MIVLDTHAWLWLVSDPAKLGKAALRAIRQDKSKGVSAISCWEIAMLVLRGRIELDRDPVTWMEQGLQAEALQLLPLTPAVAVASAQLQSLHRDPADRIILATAFSHGATLVTKDCRMRASNIIRTVW